ncbi:unnamed protein product [Effrenium voratum]|uniref:HIT-type domain-containing protein n=1 Tax=Effrenium voratum TaxID=2562239 RepID=A0AA36HXT8_9DINO|nr:unnamed protein product [Effrenium voratum]
MAQQVRRSERLRQVPRPPRQGLQGLKGLKGSERLQLLETDFAVADPLDASDGEAEKRKRRQGAESQALIGPKRRRFLFQELASRAEEGPNFFTCEATASTLPRRFFCPSCLKLARYKCPQCCGAFCSLGCQKLHKEVLCR